MASASLTFCLLSVLSAPILAILTPLDWTLRWTLVLVLVVPVALLAAGWFASNSVIAKAIESRDREERQRWHATRVPPAAAELLAARTTRVHYMSLTMVVLASVVLDALLLASLPAPPRIGSWGLILVSSGIGLGALAAMSAGVFSRRTVMWWLVSLTWLVPLGLGVVGTALVTGRMRVVFSTAGSVSPLVRVVQVLAGLVVICLGLATLGLWVAWLGQALKGRWVWTSKNSPLAKLASKSGRNESGVLPMTSAGISHFSGLSRQARAAVLRSFLNSLPDEDDVPASQTGVFADPEFDDEDVHIVQSALQPDPVAVVSGWCVLLGCAAALILVAVNINMFILGILWLVILAGLAVYMRRVTWA
ncbi:MAG: hypothetical protein SPI12_06775 [Actinomycetaceae bacterium]|nr:hypothetical protein [Actinomycetaceae bacterium]MDY6083539.1 hypothetical protein [Actinomycetaceae bacterium]